MNHLYPSTHLDQNAGYLMRRNAQEEHEPDPLTLVAGRDYDLCSPAIRCNADKAGSKVFIVDADYLCGWDDHASCRVLDFSQSAAEITFDEAYPEYLYEDED